jgi:hypothetical protein
MLFAANVLTMDAYRGRRAKFSVDLFASLPDN